MPEEEILICGLVQFAYTNPTGLGESSPEAG